MSSRSHRLPPLNALRVFWIVMQQKSFRAAADELLISPQAVSQQIRLLEDVLGVSLFDRRSRTIEPTAQAEILAPFVAAGFEEFLKGVDLISTAVDRERIYINVSPYFAARHFMARLNQFREQEPAANVRITNLTQMPNFDADEIDVSIQWGFGDWKDYDVTLIIKDPKVICCTPELARRIGSASDLCHLPLLYPIHGSHMWQNIFEYLNVDGHEQAGKIEFQDAESMRSGTLAGMGIGLISTPDALRDVAEGRLVAPLGIAAITGMPSARVPGFYAVMPRAHRRVRIVLSFYEWLMAQQWAEPE